MSYFKNSTRIFLFFLVLGNLQFSFGSIKPQESKDYPIELLLAHPHKKEHVVNYELVRHSFSIHPPVQFFEQTPHFEYITQTEECIHLLKFHILQQAFLTYKQVLFQILLNDIAHQNSHSI